MTRSASDWRIARSTGVCAATGRLLDPGEPCIVALCERPDDDAFERLDYSLDAWQSGVRPDRLYGYWKTIVPKPDERRRTFIDDDLLLNLFHRLESDTKPGRIAFRFVLALILMRKKILRLVGRSAEKGHERWRFRLRPSIAEGDDSEFEVTNPGLGDHEVREISEMFGEILEENLD